jgi:hypothetical protein
MISIIALVSCSTLLSTTLAVRDVEPAEGGFDNALPEDCLSLVQTGRGLIKQRQMSQRTVQPGLHKVSPHYTSANRSYPHRGAADGKGPSPLSLLHVASYGLLHVPYNHISSNISYHGLREQITTFPQRCPREFNVMLATFKTWLADMIVQFASPRPQCDDHSWTFDFRRSISFAIFGCVYIGLTQWFLYVTVLTWLFPDAMIFANSPWPVKMTDTEGQLDMLGQVLVDNLIFNVFVYFPAFYMIKGFIQGKGSIVSRIQEGLHNYSKNIWQDNTVSCALWIPADFFVFACPMFMRMPMEHSVSFGWTMFMSFRRGALPEKGEAIEPPEGNSGKLKPDAAA